MNVTEVQDKLKQLEVVAITFDNRYISKDGVEVSISDNEIKDLKRATIEKLKPLLLTSKLRLAGFRIFEDEMVAVLASDTESEEVPLGDGFEYQFLQSKLVLRLLVEMGVKHVINYETSQESTLLNITLKKQGKERESRKIILTKTQEGVLLEMYTYKKDKKKYRTYSESYPDVTPTNQHLVVSAFDANLILKIREWVLETNEQNCGMSKSLSKLYMQAIKVLKDNRTTHVDYGILQDNTVNISCIFENQLYHIELTEKDGEVFVRDYIRNREIDLKGESCMLEMTQRLNSI